ncbi:MAG: hypothetical protein SZ59_C0002G0258 [candidate division TM6 bacterium GW2011_GWF2_28_16]|nr:MAG: hypothetical protein SZ59_C0002G0258 [candidate division TM6 bacterium GW2011_GWF2_28_16]
MSKFLNLKNIVNKGLLLFLFIFSINSLDAQERRDMQKEHRDAYRFRKKEIY